MLKLGYELFEVNF